MIFSVNCIKAKLEEHENDIACNRTLIMDLDDELKKLESKKKGYSKMLSSDQNTETSNTITPSKLLSGPDNKIPKFRRSSDELSITIIPEETKSRLNESDEESKIMPNRSDSRRRHSTHKPKKIQKTDSITEILQEMDKKSSYKQASGNILDIIEKEVTRGHHQSSNRDRQPKPNENSPKAPKQQPKQPKQPQSRETHGSVSRYSQQQSNEIQFQRYKQHNNQIQVPQNVSHCLKYCCLCSLTSTRKTTSIVLEDLLVYPRQVRT